MMSGKKSSMNASASSTMMLCKGCAFKNPWTTSHSHAAAQALFVAEPLDIVLFYFASSLLNSLLNNVAVCLVSEFSDVVFV
jgi:hypothetical protein